MKRIFISVILALTLATVLVVPAVAAPPGPTIVDVAIAVNSEGPFAGAFDTLIAAVLAADPAVLETLSGNGQFTVFAPTDDAFALLGLNPGNIGTVPKQVLTDILLYHVARGRRYAEDVVASDRIRTLYGDFLFQDGGVLTDNLDRDANIIATDVEAANGIIHAIDAVVLPYAP
jgi:transforming growth factor-beta-induced protein